MKYTYGNFETEFDSTNFNFTEKLENLQDILTDKLGKQPTDVKFSETIRYAADCYIEFFEGLFGEGCCNTMFGDTVSIREMDKAYANLITSVRNDIKTYETETKATIAEISGNRKQRRSKK